MASYKHVMDISPCSELALTLTLELIDSHFPDFPLELLSRLVRLEFSYLKSARFFSFILIVFAVL